MSGQNLPIRIAFYEPYPMGLGGNFLTQRLILERLNRKQFEPIVVSPMEGVTLDRFRSMGVECVVLPPPGTLGRYGGAELRNTPLGRLKSIFNLVRYNVRMARFFRERKIQVVYANCIRALLLAGLGARLANVPALLYVKSTLANPILDRLCFILASKILFFCPQNRDDRYGSWVRAFRHKIDIVGIGLDPALIAAAESEDQSGLRRELGIDPNCFNVVVLAQLVQPKGQHLAIEALSRLVGEFPQLRLYLVGDHVLDEYRPYKKELETMILRHRLVEHVRFTGWRLDSLAIASLMDALIHPSLAEGFGFSVLEAMALGKPVIASAVGGLREAIQDGQNGYLVTPGDVDGITARWRDLLGSEELRRRLGQEARRTVLRDYMVDDKVARLSEIWAEMAAGR